MSNRLAERLNHTSIADNNVQDRRHVIQVPGGLSLHGYANLYFDARNPMMFRRKEQYCETCVLCVSLDILKLSDVIVTDKNASSNWVRFYSVEKGLSKIDFDEVFQRNWNHADEIKKMRLKSAKCAEVLVPDKIDFGYIRGALVANKTVEQKLNDATWALPITINPDIFFM